ncbi:23480_t:CDS:2, partial [Gigaspora rosea]
NLEDFHVPEDEAMIFSGHRSREAIRAYSSPTDDQRLSSTALLIPYTAHNEDLESYYSFPGDSYIEYESDENEETDAEVIEVPNASNQNRELLNTVTNSSNQSQELVNPTPNSSILFLSLKSPIINNKKMRLEQTMRSKEAWVQESREAQAQESRETLVQESSEAQVHKTRESQVQEVREAQAQNRTLRNNQQRQVIEHHEDEQALMPITSKERRALQPITNNIIVQIPDTEKPININLKISFNNQ